MTADPGPALKLTWKLADLALLTEVHVVESNKARRPTLVSPMSVDKDLFENAFQTHDQRHPTPDSPTSDVTLIGDPILTPDSDVDENQKDNELATESTIEGTGTAAGNQSPSHNRADSLEPGGSVSSAPPSRAPPPVPPRPEQNWKKTAEDSALQHDVHEVIGSVLYKIQCAIRPDGFDSQDNRLNRIKE